MIVMTTVATRPTPATGLSLAQGSAVSISAVLGTGVIALPALAAQVAGPASLVAWVIMIVLSVPLAMTFAALGARYPDSGGVATYVRTAFGARMAAVVGWTFYFAVPAGAPAAAMFGGAYVSALVGGGLRTTYLTAGALTLIVVLINLGGIRISGTVQLGMAALLVTLLLVATLSALPHADPGNLTPFAPHGWWALGPAVSVLVWGFAGWEALTSLAADFRDPARNVPRATVIALVVVSVLYLGVVVASLLVLGPTAGATGAPLSELLAVGLGGGAQVITTVAALLLTLGAMNAYFAGISRLGAALGRDGALPAWFARGSAAGEVPRRSLAVVAGLSLAALAAVASVGAGPRLSVQITTGSFILIYVLGTASAVKLLPRRTWMHRAAVVALGCVLILLVMTGVYVLWTLLVAGAALVYMARRHRVTD
ncbi:amino acid permease [Virgisporangium aliadipatigenens]|uniref:Amino acid permease n=2 Tax=Virgisporangium aliadipatigenens TaxID=741659 RepID=A0A8J4DWE9_9ACTN|nr:amino acid permease [Virgisporangium aliadipatigenens]